ncbi:hypothetical protein QJS04_geneDACA017169 [Acorus gramineus]|uniref:Transmembrane protein 45B n=1 Tax=Acorus gramineus TaxID=55184 RepID=A0AAV9BPY1_ACOGR|nr:hypothetical protein QJS04_geneDACA017169 [Acorus gramineus]
MGTFTGHIVPGLAFALLGLWHVLNTIKSYTTKPPTTPFKSRTWHPINTPLIPLRRLEPLAILSFSLAAIAAQFFDNHSPLPSLEHATMFIHLAIFASASLATDADARAPLLDVLVASVFAQELFLLRFHSTDHVGFEGHYHWLLQLVVAVSLASSAALLCVPNSFHAALVRAVSLVLQGCWFANMAFALWVPGLAFEGCFEGACATVEADARARALANLQFSWVSAGVSVATVGVWLWAVGMRADAANYRQLSSANAGGGQLIKVEEGLEIPVVV